jgi:hypothetical protein
MVKIISNEEYAKLKEDVDYWKTLATTSAKEHVKRVDEYKILKEKYNKLDKEKVTFVSFGEVKSLRKARKIAEELKKTFNNEHNSL